MYGCSFLFHLTSLETAHFLHFPVYNISKIAEEAFSICYYLFKIKKTQNTNIKQYKEI